MVLAYDGEIGRAKELASELEERFSGDTIVKQIQLPQARAAIAIKQGDYARALQELEVARPYERANLVTILERGQAYMGLEDWAAAESEFQNILDHPGVMTGWVGHALARLGKARALANAGNDSEARLAYQDLLALWSDADEDLPILAAVKSEYEALE